MDETEDKEDSEGAVTIDEHFRSLHDCFILPFPPNLDISRQWMQEPQLSLLHDIGNYKASEILKRNCSIYLLPTPPYSAWGDGRTIAPGPSPPAVEVNQASVSLVLELDHHLIVLAAPRQKIHFFRIIHHSEVKIQESFLCAS